MKFASVLILIFALFTINCSESSLVSPGKNVGSKIQKYISENSIVGVSVLGSYDEWRQSEAEWSPTDISDDYGQDFAIDGEILRVENRYYNLHFLVEYFQITTNGNAYLAVIIPGS